jgi:hypothetical protein
MTLLELSAVASVLAGAIAGGARVESVGAIPIAAGVFVGLATGIIVYFSVMRMAALILQMLDVDPRTEREGPLQSFSLIAVLLAPMLSPVASWYLAARAVGWIIR